MSQRLASWLEETTGSPSPAVSHGPPKPLQIVVIPRGPITEAPVVLLKTWNPSLTICTYCVAPTSPLVSGGAQLHATPGKKMPLKLRIGLGMFGATRLSNTSILSWTTGSGLSLCLVGTFGFSFSCWVFGKAG